MFPYITLISAFASQMALLGFIFPPFTSPRTCHLMVEDYSLACQRERSKKKEGKEKSPQKNHFAVTRIGALGLCLKSRACYTLGHGALPKLKYLNLELQNASDWAMDPRA